MPRLAHSDFSAALHAHCQGPPLTEYLLSPHGTAMSGVILTMALWAS